MLQSCLYIMISFTHTQIIIVNWLANGSWLQTEGTRSSYCSESKAGLDLGSAQMATSEEPFIGHLQFHNGSKARYKCNEVKQVFPCKTNRLGSQLMPIEC